MAVEHAHLAHLASPHLLPFSALTACNHYASSFHSLSWADFDSVDCVDTEIKTWGACGSKFTHGETKMQSMKWGTNSGKDQGERGRESHKCAETDGNAMGVVEDGEGIKKKGKLDGKGMGELNGKSSVDSEGNDKADRKRKGRLNSIGSMAAAAEVYACSIERQKKGASHEKIVDAHCYLTTVIVPHDFVCGISKRVMEDPVVVASGQSYERACIQAWLDGGNTHCPITQKPLSHLHLIPNLTLKTLISSWLASHSCNLDTSTHHTFSSAITSFSSCTSLGTPIDAHNQSFFSCSSSSLPKLLSDSEFYRFSSSSIDSCSHGIPERLRATLNDRVSSTPSTSGSSRSEQERIVRFVQNEPVLANSQCPSPYPSLKSLQKRHEKEDPRLKSVQNGRLHCNSEDPMLPSVKPSIYRVSRINTLVSNLQSEYVDKQRSAAAQLRLLAKHDDDNRIIIANAGALGPLVALLQSSDEATQQEATTTLLNLSLNCTIKADIIKEGAIEPLVRVLREGLSSVAMENAAVALASLSVDEENKVKIGSAHAILPLVDLLDSGSSRGKKDAATALYRLSSVDENKRRMVRAGASRLLVDFMCDDGGTDGMVDKALAILRNLASIEEGRVSIVEEGGIMFLLQIIQTGSRRSKGLAVPILFQLCSHSTEHRFLVLQKDPLPALLALSKTGSSHLKAQVAEIIHVLVRHT